MCCFSGPVQEVSGTSIFARLCGRGEQALVYQMIFKSLDDLAMILPLPTPADANEDALKFIDLKEYEDFFVDMRRGFPEPRAEPSRGEDSVKGRILSAPLKVVEVGNFEASFVPQLKDFARLDERFRLPGKVWAKLPQYDKYGFAVFKLKKGEHRVHPMAFVFPTTLKKTIFFPTVHIHDGAVHDKARFDHELYCQIATDAYNSDGTWVESPQPAGMFLDKKKAGSLIDPDAHVHRLRLRGNLKNQDTLV